MNFGFIKNALFLLTSPQLVLMHTLTIFFQPGNQPVPTSIVIILNSYFPSQNPAPTPEMYCMHCTVACRRNHHV